MRLLASDIAAMCLSETLSDLRYLVLKKSENDVWDIDVWVFDYC